jgi:hypothetical protein
MTKVYNESILIKYLYQEASSEEVKLVESVLQRSSRIRREFRQMQKLTKDLNNVQFGPSKATVKNIISRSQNQNWLIL